MKTFQEAAQHVLTLAPNITAAKQSPEKFHAKLLAFAKQFPFESEIKNCRELQSRIQQEAIMLLIATKGEDIELAKSIIEGCMAMFFVTGLATGIEIEKATD